jgi:hypothetical protein
MLPNFLPTARVVVLIGILVRDLLDHLPVLNKVYGKRLSHMRPKV